MFVKNVIVIFLAMTLLDGAEQTLIAYNPYGNEPFVTASGGLASDIVAYLNGKLKGKYRFVLQTVPRKRINQTVIHNPQFKGIVLLLAPEFVGDSSKTKFLWSKPLFYDSNAVISSRTKKIEYTSPESLNGMRFGGILGNRYSGLESKFGREVKRFDTPSELSNLRKVAAERVDVTIMGFSIYRYTTKKYHLGDQLWVSSKAHSIFTRNIFSSKGETKLIQEIDAVLDATSHDPQWHAIMKRYSLE